ncbi:hypothetical protein GCM10025883_13410 [Mobilicoccus caccae]|uniref:Uncharacterized protein n=1 Tax=Mobilicoccus caccae TaxID=1859295 RepID=A0ABQ6INH8_9MICO|nr:hypothetical protein GCM10025883_13410 [Mobilicoccus caccae]
MQRQDEPRRREVVQWRLGRDVDPLDEVDPPLAQGDDDEGVVKVETDVVGQEDEQPGKGAAERGGHGIDGGSPPGVATGPPLRLGIGTRQGRRGGQPRRPWS